MFANPPAPLIGVNFRIKFSLLGLNEMSRSAQKSHSPNPHIYVSVGGVYGINLHKAITRDWMKNTFCQLPSLMGVGTFYKNIFP